MPSFDNCNGCGKYPCECVVSEPGPDYSAPLKSQVFVAETLEAAMARAAEFKERVDVDREHVTEVRHETVTGEGKTREQASDSARARLPFDAFNIGAPEVLREGRSGVLEITGFSRRTARKRWPDNGPDEAKLDSLRCIKKPGGFLWFNRTVGTWEARWSTPFKVCISYDRPVEVTIWYR